MKLFCLLKTYNFYAFCYMMVNTSNLSTYIICIKSMFACQVTKKQNMFLFPLPRTLSSSEDL